MLSKLGKALSVATTRAALLQTENERLLHQLQHARDKAKKKRVRVNPNERFSEVEAIKAAIDQAEAEAAQTTTKPVKKAAARPRAAPVAIPYLSMCTQFQI